MDVSPLLVLLSLVVIFLAIPIAFAVRALGAPARVVQRVIPAGVLTGGFLLAAGLLADSWAWVLVTVLGVAGLELAALFVCAVVAVAGRLRALLLSQLSQRRS